MTKDISWTQGKWLGEEGNANVNLVAYDTPGLGDTYGRDPKTLSGIAEEVEAKENGRFNTFLLVVKVDYFFDKSSAHDYTVLTYLIMYKLHCKCLQGFTKSLRGNQSAGISNLWGLHAYPQSL